MENRGRTLSVDFANAVGRTVKAQPLTAIDYGQILEIHGLPLPPSFECHFSKNGATAYKSIGTTEDGVGTVPFVDEQTQSGGIITAYIYLHETADDGETEYRIIIPVESRPGATPAEPTPVEQDVIAQAISALNNAVTTTNANVEITEANKTASAQSAQEAEADANRADLAWNGAVIAQNSAQASADTASQKADEASVSAQSAHNYSEYAHSYALGAEQDAQSAGQSATSAQNSANTAESAKNTAVTKANEASQSAQSASQSAQTASQSAQSAQNSATQANTSATNASASAQSASASEASASASATSAQESAESAQASADRAEQEADRWYEFLPVDTASGSLVHVTDGAKDVPVKALSVALEPIQSGSGDPSPDNVRPITGHTQVVVTRTGKNLLNPTFYRGVGYNPAVGAVYSFDAVNYVVEQSDGVYKITADNYGFRRSATVPLAVRDGETYAFDVTMSADSAVQVITLDSDYKVVRKPFVRQYTTTGAEATATITVASGEKYIAVGFFAREANTDATFTNPQLELGSSSSSYEPFTKQSITIPLGDTVYGGTLDVVNGVLTVDRGMATMTKDSNWGWNQNQTLANFSVPNAVVVDASTQRDVLVENNMFTSSSWVGRGSNEYSCGLFYGAPYVFVKGTNITSVDDLKAVLGDNTLQVVYPLATPITVPLTANQMTTLLGINNVWSDSGDVSVDYRADVQLYIQKMIANALNA